MGTRKLPQRLDRQTAHKSIRAADFESGRHIAEGQSGINPVKIRRRVRQERSPHSQPGDVRPQQRITSPSCVHHRRLDRRKINPPPIFPPGDPVSSQRDNEAERSGHLSHTALMDQTKARLCPIGAYGTGGDLTGHGPCER